MTNLPETHDPEMEHGAGHGAKGKLGIPARLPELDGLRGLAALAVVFHHIAQELRGLTVPRMLGEWLAVSRLGWMGVDVFFALSGFLITRILLETKTRPHFYRNFYARRVLRLAPPYLMTLVLVACFIPHSWAFIGFSLIYLSNLTVLFGVPLMFGPLWSLAVEEHFYLVWPWLVRFLSGRVLLAISFAVCALTPVLRHFEIRTFGVYDTYFSWFRFDGMLWGASLAILMTLRGATRRGIGNWSTWFGVAGVIGFFGIGGWDVLSKNSFAASSVVYSVVALMTTGLIGYAALDRLGGRMSLLRLPVLRFFGDISYWVYLFHVFALMVAMRWIRHDDGVGWGRYLAIAAVTLGLSVLTGVAMRRYVELPALRLKARFR